LADAAAGDVDVAAAVALDLFGDGTFSEAEAPDEVEDVTFGEAAFRGGSSPSGTILAEYKTDGVGSSSETPSRILLTAAI
jgi:hypothetical protein